MKNRLHAEVVEGAKACNAEPARPLVEEVQFFAGLEANGFAGRDADFGTGAGVAADARLAGLDGEDAEAAQLNAVAFAEGGLHGVEDDIHGSFCLGPWKTCALDNPLNQILLDHGVFFTFPSSA